MTRLEIQQRESEQMNEFVCSDAAGCSVRGGGGLGGRESQGGSWLMWGEVLVLMDFRSGRLIWSCGHNPGQTRSDSMTIWERYIRPTFPITHLDCLSSERPDLVICAVFPTPDLLFVTQTVCF